jgi:peptide/nickel transport system substrate-binding protein
MRLLCLLLPFTLAVAAPAQTLVFARGADSQKLDPADVDDGESVKVLINVCEGLVRFKTGTAVIEPALATSWTIAPDGRTYRFQIRPNVKFHDGTLLDARVAAFAFHRQMHPAHPARPQNATFAYWSGMFGMVESVTAVDAGTLEFKLREPHAPFLANLASFPASLISTNFISQQQPIGTGPFRFVAWKPNETITLERNPDYWDGPPKLNRLVFRVVPDSATRLIQLQTGQIQGLDGLNPIDLPLIRQDKKLQLITTAGLNVAYLAFNCEKITDINLRRAVASAINKKDLLAVVYRNEGTIAQNPLPPALLGHHDAITRPPPGPYTKPARPLRLEVMTNPRAYLPNPVRAAELIKADLAKAGLPIEIIPNEFGAHLSRTSSGQHELALLGWVGDNGDTDNFLHTLLSKETATLGSALNICFWKNDRYSDLVAAARRETVPAKRAALYRQAQEIIADEVPLVPLMHAPAMCAVRANVTGVHYEINGDILFRYVTVK